MHYRLQYHSPFMRRWTPYTFAFQHYCQPSPNYLCYIDWLLDFLLPALCSRLLFLLPRSRSVVIIACRRLMPASPPRPLQQRCCAPLDQQHYLPEQMADFCTTQPYCRKRAALKAAILLACPCLRCPFFGTTSAPFSARITLKNAAAHIASVICRYHPVHERTS